MCFENGKAIVGEFIYNGNCTAVGHLCFDLKISSDFVQFSFLI